jgi:catechol 2,3-dioxygenase-like lactoylglutathione lyase family enzyme
MTPTFAASAATNQKHGTGNAMHKIRHIAIRADDQNKVAEFYKRTFGMQELRNDGRDRAVYLSDGYITLAILPERPGMTLGIDHFGFQVDNADQVGREAAAAGGSAQLEQRPRDGRFAEFRVHDPVGSPIDLSEAGWKSA